MAFQAPLLTEEQPASQQANATATNAAKQDQHAHPAIDAAQQQGTQPVLNDLPHFVRDSLPQIQFDATVNCLLEKVDKSLSLEQFVDVLSSTDVESIPAKVLIHA